MIPAWHAAGCLTWCCWGIYSVVETCSIPQTLLHSTTVRRIYHGPKNWPRLNENFLVKRGKKNTLAAELQQQRKLLFDRNTMSWNVWENRKCVWGLSSSFSPPKLKTLSFQKNFLAVYWHEKTASENIVFKMIG